MSGLWQSLAVGAPEVILAAGAMVLLLIGVFRGDRSLVGLSWGAVVLFALAGASLIDDGPGRVLAWNGLYVADALSAFLKVVILIGAAVSVLLALPYLKRTRTARFEYPVLIVLATLGMGIMVSANNLLTLYIGLELMSLSAYVLAAFHRQEVKSAEAGLKYFVLGALSSGVLLYGVSLVYGFAGTTAFQGIGAALTGTRSIGALVGLTFVLAGLAFKISAVPFHMWTPDVYEGAPTPVAAFFASAPKVAAMGLLLRVAMDAFGGMVADWRQVVIFMAIASMLLGAVAAIGQSNVKRLLAYSSINNVGFALIGLAAATPAGISAVLFYMAVYLVMTLGSFLCVLALTDADGRAVETLDDLAGLVRTRPWLATALALFMFSLAGIPPLFGFMPKLAVFNAAVAANLWPLAVIGVLASVVGAYYYLRVVKILFFDAPAGVVVTGGSRLNGAMLAAAAVFCSPAGYLLLGPLGVATRRAAASLF
ncbi:NADH-quinone oxidoreductase subunit NuoN [Sandaracinobacteroides saxicola]|uniref:NADH-quinone oxidoreductase subunit N n=1 Tax=Sandaracinobacteroides saxicola TaxID=2759707 RepID=A0A7G5IEP6_9SPHN|nr:NADH-quinone oxidoreductase subunit NuoN [Sandaracinobacteroides saxicola]QMW21838.1 NADH-quinone oxidoreductase subunit NuoN [Sandaracinobacteroides saxicola]